MRTDAEVDLGDGGDAVAFRDVEEEADFDAVSAVEHDRVEHLARAAVSPARGWRTPARSGKQRASEGRAASSVTRPPLAAAP